MASRDEPSAATSFARKATTRSPAPRDTSTTSPFPDLLYARTIRSTIPAGEIRRRSASNFDTDRLHDRRPPRHSRPEHRRADRGRSAVPGRARRSATSPSRSCCWRTRIASAAGRRRADRLPPRRRRSTTRRRRRSSFKTIAIDKGDVDDGFAAADVDRRGRVPHRPSGAALHRAERRRSRCRSDGGITVYGSLQCPYYVHRALTVLLGLPDDKVRVDPDRDRRRVRRQGGVPVDDRRPRGAARAARPAGR